MKFHNEDIQTKPPLRDIKQFISPNPRVVNSAVLFKEHTTTDLKAHAEAIVQMQHSADTAAFIVDTTACPHIRDDSYLLPLREKLSFPFLRLETMTEIDNIFDTRLMRFDGQITSPQHFSAKEFYNLVKFAQAQDLFIVPAILDKEDWKKVLPVSPKMVYIAADIGETLPPMVKEAGIWLMGEGSLREKYNLKCVVEGF
ncbi:MAG: hypothetical protein HQM16_14610 [Deltaproteobacteria bacterium]|nr:hypothetical protein [Deltaproteobacteria bacterium]